MKTDDDGWVRIIEIQDHSKGLKIEYQDYADEWEEIFDVKTLPLGEKVLQVNVLTDLLEGVTVRKKGPELIVDAKVPDEIKKRTPQPTLPEKPKAALPTVPATPVTLNTRTKGGVPTTVHAPLFAEENLYLHKDNEKFRKAIIESARRFNFTPHALAAIIHAEAAKTKEGAWIEASAAGGSNARGLGQFLDAAWYQYIAKDGTLGNAAALKFFGVAKLEAAYGKLYKISGKNRTEISGAEQKTILSWRDNGAYSIDAIGSYAEDNFLYLKNHKIDVMGLPSDEKVKIAYIMHHEGTPDGLWYLQGKLGKTIESPPNKLKIKLAKQYQTKKDDGTAKAKALADRFDGDYVKAYYYFLANHTDTMVCVKSFMLKHDGFTELSAYEVIKKAGGNEVERPKSVVSQSAPPKKQESNFSKSPVQTKQEGVGGVPGWSDPLDSCVIRVGGYCDSINNPGNARTKSLFGGRGGKHTGIDLCAIPGTPVKAVSNGKVIYVGVAGAFGNVILLEVNINDLPAAQVKYARTIDNIINDTIYFLYAHLSTMDVDTEDYVKAGAIIGKTGHSGNAKKMTEVGPYSDEKYGAHLHFEARRSSNKKKGEGKWFDPKPLLTQCG